MAHLITVSEETKICFGLLPNIWNYQLSKKNKIQHGGLIFKLKQAKNSALLIGLDSFNFTLSSQQPLPTQERLFFSSCKLNGHSGVK